MIWLYKAPSRTPDIDCYWVGAVPNLYNSHKAQSIGPQTYPGQVNIPECCCLFPLISSVGKGGTREDAPGICWGNLADREPTHSEESKGVLFELAVLCSSYGGTVPENRV